MDTISRASTPLITIDCGEADPSLFTAAYLTISQAFTRLSEMMTVADVPLESMEIEGNKVLIRLDAESTYEMVPDLPVYVQFRAVDQNGHEVHTRMVECRVGQILHDEVIE